MPVIITFGRTRLIIYQEDHAPPHFHLLTPSGDVMVDIRTTTILEGGGKPSDIRKALGWTRENRRLLMTHWERLK